MFQYDWTQFNTKMGLIFMVGTIVVFGLMEQVQFSMNASGISALLAWITVILVPDKRWGQHLTGLCCYCIIGAILTCIATALLPYSGVRLLSVAIATFIGYLMLLKGVHHFMTAWCLVYWYMLVPLFLKGEGLKSVLIGHLLGAGLVIFLNLLKPFWRRATARETAVERSQSAQEEKPESGFAIRYAAIVSMGIAAGLAAGMKWLTSDPTLIANATLNIISPSLKQTWLMGVERVILGAIGIVAGFYFGWFFPEPWVGIFVACLFSFLSLAVLYISMGLVICSLFFLISYSWGQMRSELGHLIANEKLISEFLGVVIAVLAIAVLIQLQKRKTEEKESSE